MNKQEQVERLEELRKHIARQGMSKEALARALAGFMIQVAPDFKKGIDQAEEIELARKTISSMMVTGNKEKLIMVFRDVAEQNGELDADWKELCHSREEEEDGHPTEHSRR